MLAYGKLKEKSAFKVYCKSKDVPFEIANEITKQLTEYENKLKYADEEEKEFIKVEQFVSEEYIGIYNESKRFQGLIDSVSPSPCSFLLYDKSISRDVGVMRIGKKDSSIIVACIDGKTSDKWKFLKNDILTVSVWDVIGRVFERINKPILSVNELLGKVEKDSKVWDIYKRTCTIGINQVEKPNTAKKCSNYAPINETELSMFVA